MVIPSSWWVPTVAFAGEPTTVALLITPCTSRYPISSPTCVQGSTEGHRRTMHVLILTQEHCGFCEQAKEVLDRLAPEYGLSVSTLDLDSPKGEALAVRGGILFPPGIFLDGEPFSYGRPSERRLRREIERRLRSVEGGTSEPHRLLD